VGLVCVSNLKAEDTAPLNTYTLKFSGNSEVFIFNLIVYWYTE
jgi:hypothetical protein